MRILALDCADKAVSCAVVDDGIIRCEQFSNTGFTHSKTLMPMIQSMLSLAEIPMDSIERIAITSGPGSFTGLRIGIAAVKGLAFAGNIPCVGVSTLEAIAFAQRMHKGVICAAMDARCRQIYCALFESDGHRLTRLCDDMAISLDDAKAILDKQYPDRTIYLAGPGAHLFASFEDARLVFPSARFTHQRASDVAILSEQYEAVQASALQPTYLRLPQAERELNERKKNQ